MLAVVDRGYSEEGSSGASLLPQLTPKPPATRTAAVSMLPDIDVTDIGATRAALDGLRAAMPAPDTS